MRSYRSDTAAKLLRNVRYVKLRIPWKLQRYSVCSVFIIGFMKTFRIAEEVQRTVVVRVRTFLHAGLFDSSDTGNDGKSLVGVCLLTNRSDMPLSVSCRS